jgi:hypothetical protein
MKTQLPIWAIEEIDKLRREFFWAGNDSSVQGKCLVSRPVICLPTAQGGLGVMDFRLAGVALRTRWLWLQRTDPDRAWAALPVHIELEVRQLFEASVLVQVGNGAKTVFWTDCWLDGEAVVDMAPVLASLVCARIKKTRTVQQAISNRAWVQDIKGGSQSRPSLNTFTSGIVLKLLSYNQIVKTTFAGAGRRMVSTLRTLRS